ncbi:MAG: hypothetical protein WCC90_17340 [Methylocella sp.]
MFLIFMSVIKNNGYACSFCNSDSGDRGCTSQEREQNVAKSLITQTVGGPSHGVLGLIEISDKIARLSEAEYAFETKRRKLEQQFEVTNSELREEYLAAVLEIHDSPETKMTGVTH